MIWGEGLTLKLKWLLINFGGQKTFCMENYITESSFKFDKNFILLLMRPALALDRKILRVFVEILTTLSNRVFHKKMFFKTLK